MLSDYLCYLEQNFPSESQPTYFITNDVFQVSYSPKGIFVDFALSPPTAEPSSLKRLRLQVDSGCSCSTTNVTDLNNLPPVQVNPSPVRFLDCSKTVIPTTGHATLQCTRRGESYEIVVQIVTVQRYYPPLLGLAEGPRMGIINYNVDTANQMEDIQIAPPPFCELSLDYIKQANPKLCKGLGKLCEPFSISLNHDVKPIHAPPHHYAAPKLPIIKEALD